jgi:small conductance mechanosensitive channel
MIDMAVRPWCKSEHYWETYFYMQEHLKRAFDENGVALPKPGMDINVVQ